MDLSKRQKKESQDDRRAPKPFFHQLIAVSLALCGKTRRMTAKEENAQKRMQTIGETAQSCQALEERWWQLEGKTFFEMSQPQLAPWNCGHYYMSKDWKLPTPPGRNYSYSHSAFSPHSKLKLPAQ